MNRFYKILIVFVTLSFLMGCSKEFLNVNNENGLTDNSFYKTEQDFEDLCITGYTPLAYGDLFGQAIHTLGFAIDDRILHEQINLDQLQYNSSDGNITKLYNGLYVGIYRTNLFFEKFSDDIAFSDPARRETMKGEMHFLRGVYFFYLASWFEVAPLLTETAKDPLKGLANSKQEDIYAQAESDLLEAINLLPVAWPDEDLGRATRGAAKAFLGKTYLYQAKFDKATDILGELIADGTYSLNKPQGTDSLDYVHAYLSNFTSIDMPGPGNTMYKSEFNTESIYEVNFSMSWDEGARASQYLPARRSTGSLITWYNGPSVITGGYGNIAMEDDKFPASFEKPANHPAGLEFDPRYYAIFIRPGDIIDFREGYAFYNKPYIEGYIYATIPSAKGMRKGLYPYHTTDTWANAPFQDPNNWRLMRYADVLLMYTEAAFRSGKTAGTDPLDALNQVRERVGMPKLTALSRDAIIHERDIEMACEHNRFWDLGRWYKDGWIDLDYIHKTLPTYEPKNVCFPIPLSEINKHYGVLKQNPKWE